MPIGIRDDKLPGMAALLDTGHVAQLISQKFCSGNQPFSNLLIANIRYKPQTNCLVSYTFGPEDEQKWLHAKAFPSDDWPNRKGKFPSTAFLDESFATAYFGFPFDQDLPALSRFVQKPEAFLDRILFEPRQSQSVERIDILSYKPNRRFTARVQLASQLKLILKIHDERSFSRAVAAAKALKREVAIENPERLGRSHRFRAIATEWIQGTSLNSSSSSNYFEEIFEYLCRLNQPINQKKFGLKEKKLVERLHDIAEYMALIYPAMNARIHNTCKKLVGTYENDERQVLLHGDCHSQQFLRTDHGIAACDFDNCAIGNPAIDVANFVAHLFFDDLSQRTNGAEHAFELAQQPLGNSNPKFQPDQLLWHVLAFKFLLLSHPFRSGNKNWQEMTCVMLNNLEQGLKDLQSSSFRSNHTSESTRRDQSLPGSSSYFEEASVRQALNSPSPFEFPSMRVMEVKSINSLRHKKGKRCLVKYELNTQQGPRTIVGKSRAKGLDTKTIKAQRSLAEDFGFGMSASDRIRVPEVVGVHPHWNMWFQEWVPGKTFGELMARNQLNDRAIQTGKSIAKLHRSGFVPHKSHTLHDEIDILEVGFLAVASKLPHYKGRLNCILSDCQDLVSRVGDQTTCIHRDFYQDQIVFSGDTAYLIDLDLICNGHPAIDIGNFVAHLCEHGIRLHGDGDYWKVAANQLITSYLTEKPNVSRGDIDIMVGVSLARHIVISQRIESRQPVTPQIIEEVEIKLACLRNQTAMAGP